MVEKPVCTISILTMEDNTDRMDIMSLAVSLSQWGDLTVDTAGAAVECIMDEDITLHTKHTVA